MARSAQGLAQGVGSGSSCFPVIFLFITVTNIPAQFRAWFPGLPPPSSPAPWWLPGPAGFKFICSFIHSFIC